MESKEFKTLFDAAAKVHGFDAAYGGWYRDLPAALLVLSLQKSNFGNYFELNIKLFLDRSECDQPARFKNLIKNLPGDIFRRQPEESRSAFDLDASLTTSGRRDAIDKMFVDLIGPITSDAATPAGILRLRDAGVLHILPAIEARLRSFGGTCSQDSA